MKYIDNFLNFNCSLDILKLYKGGSVYRQLSNDFSKEISESMSIINTIKPIVKAHKKVVLIDLCAGNALTSIISCFLFKNLKAIAVDLKVRKEDFSSVANFQYVNQDINTFEYIPEPDEYVIIIGIHACKNRSLVVCDIYHKLHTIAKSNCTLVLMPCCIGKMKPNYTILNNTLSKYELWCLYIADYLKSLNFINVNVKRDVNIISPCNIVVLS